MISVENTRRIETNNRYKIKSDTYLTNQHYTSSGKDHLQGTNGDKEHMDVEVNCESGDDQVYQLAKSYRLAKT